MKISIAQTGSQKSRVKLNIKNHVSLIDQAIKSCSDLIVFPELSLTNYEPSLAKQLATNFGNSVFNPFQELSNKNEIVICVGMPTLGNDGVLISMLIFQPHKEREVYSKQILHSDEQPYFVRGHCQKVIRVKNTTIAFGICYETLQREHFIAAHQKGADIYIASVAKPQNGVNKAYKYFPKLACEFETPILMSNCVGACDDFISAGQSAVWNNKGELVEQLDDKNQGLISYDYGLN